MNGIQHVYHSDYNINHHEKKNLKTFNLPKIINNNQKYQVS